MKKRYDSLVFSSLKQPTQVGFAPFVAAVSTAREPLADRLLNKMEDSLAKISPWPSRFRRHSFQTHPCVLEPADAGRLRALVAAERTQFAINRL